MKIQRLIRWFVLLFAVLMALVIFIANAMAGCFDIVGGILLTGLFILPNATYFFITMRVKSLVVLLIPAVLLCSFEVYVDYIYLVSESSTTAIMFVFTPFYEVAIVLFGLGAGIVIQVILNRVRKRRSGVVE